MEEVTLDEVFSNLTKRLFNLKSCRLEIAMSNYQDIFKPIGKYAFSFPPEKILPYLISAIDSLSEVEILGIQVLQNYLAIGYDDTIEDEFGNLYEPWEAEGKRKEVFNNHILTELKYYRDHLIALKNSVQERESQLNTLEKAKINLTLSVDEIGALFRGFEAAGIIADKGRSNLSRLISEYFSSKRKDELSASSVKNKMDSPTGAAIISILAKIDEVATALSKIKKEIK